MTRREWRLLASGGILALCLASTSYVQAAGFATAGIGIKARSMGGAFRGLADDWSAARYNPAGLAFLETNELNVTLGTYSPRMTYVPSVAEGVPVFGFNKANGLDNHPVDNIWPIPSFAGILAPNENRSFALGAAVYWPHDLNYGWDIFRVPASYNTDYMYPKQEYRTDMDVLDIHPVAAIKVSDNLSFGAGMSLTNGDLIYNRVLPIENTLGAPYDDAYPNFLGDFRTDGNGFGIGANVGVFWRASDKVSAGLNIQSPVSIKMEGLATLTMAWPRSPALNDLQLMDGFQKTFFAGNGEVGLTAQPQSSADYTFDLDLPAEIGGGIGIRPNERLVVAFDVALTLWSSIDEWVIELADGGLNAQLDTLIVTSVTVPFDWKDQVRISGGCEYFARENLAVRGGAYFDGGASVDETFSLSFPAVGSRFGVTGGMSYTVDGRWNFGAAQEVAFYSERSVTGGQSDEGLNVFPGDYSQTRFETIVSVSYLF